MSCALGGCWRGAFSPHWAAPVTPVPQFHIAGRCQGSRWAWLGMRPQPLLPAYWRVGDPPHSEAPSLPSWPFLGSMLSSVPGSCSEQGSWAVCPSCPSEVDVRHSLQEQQACGAGDKPRGLVWVQDWGTQMTRARGRRGQTRWGCSLDLCISAGLPRHGGSQGDQWGARTPRDCGAHGKSSPHLDSSTDSVCVWPGGAGGRGKCVQTQCR